MHPGILKLTFFNLFLELVQIQGEAYMLPHISNKYTLQVCVPTSKVETSTKYRQLRTTLKDSN